MIKIYGIKNCDTIKKTLKMFDELEINFEFIDFKKTPPTSTLIKSWTKSLGELPVNKRGTTFRKIKEDFESSTQSSQIKLLVENSSAIKRPIIDTGKEVILGFDKERIQALS